VIAIIGLERDHALRYLESHVVEKYQFELFRRFQELPFRAVAQRAPLFEWSQIAKSGRWVNLEIEWVVTCVDAALGLPFLVAAAVLSLPAAAAAGAFAILCLLLSWQSARQQAAKLPHVVEARERKHEAVHAMVHGMELIRSDGLRGPTLDELERRAHREHQGDLSVADWRSFTVGVSNFAERALWLVPFSLLGWQCIVGTSTLATCIAAIQLISIYAFSVRELMGAIEKAAEIRSLETFAVAWTTAPSPPAELGEPAPGHAIDVRDVSFRYRDDAPWVLDTFSLTMRCGEHRVLRWPSGCGKTTLLRLIAGVYEPDRGTVLVRRSASGARDICYVPQTTPLLEDTLQENLNHLSGGAPAARIAEAARRTGLDELVATWPMGWETMLSSRVLSTGQRQLVTMTAVLASEASIVLLDETTAHLDAALRARLAGAFEGRTLLAVDHRNEPARD
jgi:ABC-type multidrug transport system fused ATPase/permease subunit